VKTALISTLLAVGATFAATGPANAENAMYSCVDANGVVALTNVPTGADCEKLFSYTAPAPAPTVAPATASAATTPAHVATFVASTTEPASSETDSAADSDSPKTLTKPAIAQRRDDILQATRAAYQMGQPLAAGNPAVNRRYLMTNRADYQRANGVILP
jgi:hypothetical protein